MAKILIKNGLIINRGQSKFQDILIDNDRIARIDDNIDTPAQEIDAQGLWVIPGIIDDQVHFREPGLTHKANLYTESRAALAGGVTSFMEMPNTKPTATTQEELAKKYTNAQQNSIVNYSFFMGATNDNLDEVLRTNAQNVCGIKVFMGSSTGNMLVDNEKTLEQVFSNTPMLIATHCEEESIIRKNMASYQALGRPLTAADHPHIRSREGCYASSSKAVALARRHGARLHVLHITTQEELDLFDNNIPLEKKKITSEACVHHMYFNSSDYGRLGNQIKCNPAIKEESDRLAIIQAVKDHRIDIIATDHAPHTWEEKQQEYLNAPSGLPLIQHTLLMMLHHYNQGLLSKELIIEKMCHNPAILFRIEDRGFLDEGKLADIVLVDPNAQTTVHKKDLLYKCGWSPLENQTLPGKIVSTIVNGVLKYDDGKILDQSAGQRLTFSTH